MTGMRRRCKTAWMIRAGGPAADSRPDTKILVSRTTRTLAPNRCHLSGNLFRGDAQFACGAAYLADRGGPAPFDLAEARVGL